MGLKFNPLLPMGFENTGSGGGGSAVTTVGPVGSTPNSNAATIVGGTLALQPADGTNPGVLTALAQTIGGNKTFTGSISASNLSGINSGNVTLNIPNGLSLVGQALSLQLASASQNGSLSSTDWTTFNNKQASGNYITALTGEVTASGPGSVSATLLNSAVIGKILTGFVSGPNSTVLATDSILQGFEKLQAQVSASGTVTSVALTVPSIFSISGSPITTSGTLALALSNEAANTVFAGPATGAATIPTFRTLTATDIPLISLTTGISGVLPIVNGGTNSAAVLNNNRILISSGGAIVESPALTNGQILIGATGSAPIPGNLSAGVGITITNGANTISIATTNAPNLNDIPDTQFTAADNQAISANVTGFSFINANVRSFSAIVSIVRNATYSQYKINGIQKASLWEIVQSYIGDDTGILFSITTSGQIQYTSTSTGFTANIHFRAITTGV